MERGNNSSWAARDPTCPVIPMWSNGGGHLTEAQKASHALKTAQNKEWSKALQEAITQFVQEQGKRLYDLALAHHISNDHIKNLISLETHYKKACELQLQNALIHAKSKEVNKGLVHGQKYIMAEIQKMVVDDPNMCNLSCEQKKDFIKQLMDYLMDGVSKELHVLQDRTGIYATVLMVWGHVNDQIQLTWIVTDNASEFWEDQMEVALDDVAYQFEEWACIQKKNIFACEDLPSLQRQAATLILRHATGKMDITMNYQNYDKAIVLVYGIKLDGWPVGLPFITPSHLHTVVEVCTL
ncbi:hypothetical protein BDR06DRAFT_1004159 [Suillus hirtellus]|nr:hypothetical protein BDR06DRAFT_1004159 [Suillus hirtellus]